MIFYNLHMSKMEVYNTQSIKSNDERLLSIESCDVSPPLEKHQKQLVYGPLGPYASPPLIFKGTCGKRMGRPRFPLPDSYLLKSWLSLLAHWLFIHCQSFGLQNLCAVFVTVFLNSDKGYITKEALRRKVFKRNIPLVGLYSPLSLIQFPQNASLVTADSRAPLINAAKRKCLSLSGRVWLFKTSGIVWCNPTERHNPTLKSPCCNISVRGTWLRTVKSTSLL